MSASSSSASSVSITDIDRLLSDIEHREFVEWDVHAVDVRDWIAAHQLRQTNPSAFGFHFERVLCNAVNSGLVPGFVSSTLRSEQGTKERGIDLLLTSVDGVVHPAQVKVYGGKVSWTAASNILACDETGTYDGAPILIAPNGVSRDVVQEFRGKHAQVWTSSELDEWGVDWSSIEDAPRQRVIGSLPELRSYQTPRVESVLSALDDGADDVLFRWACGTGKTLTIPFVVDSLRPRTVVFVAPRRSLISQQISRMLATTPVLPSIHHFCSIDDDDSRGSLDPADLHAFLDGPGDRWVTTTTRSIGVLVDALRGRSVDLIVVDECHRLPDVTLDAFGRRLFLSATPTQSIIDRVDAISDFTYAEAAAIGCVRQFRAHHLVVSDEMRDTKASALVAVSDENDGERTIRLGEHFVMQALAEGRISGKLISYHVSIEQARRFAAEVARLDGWTALHVSSGQDNSTNDAAMNEFTEATGNVVLTSCQSLVEGIDVPSCDGVLLLRGVTSPASIQQIVGRACRRAPGEDPSKQADVWIMSFMDEVKRHQLAVIDELCKLSPVFADDYKRSTSTSTWDSEGRLYEPVVLDGDDIEAARLELHRSTIDDIDWLTRLHECVAFREQHGRWPRQTVSEPLTENERSLGRWVACQRDAFFGGRLAEPRRDILNAVEGWVWDFREADWDERLAEFADWVDRGRTWTKKSDRSEQETSLWHWVQNQRRLARHNELSDIRRAKLDATDGWSWESLSDEQWRNSCDELVAAVDRLGRLPMPSEDHSVALWCAAQRNEYACGDLPDERRSALEAVPGWTWRPRLSAWDEIANEVEAWMAGHDREPRKSGDETPREEARLGDWMSARRGEFKRGKLSAERVERLLAIPGWTWNAVESGWDRGFNEVVAWYSTNDRHPIIGVGGQEGKLAQWVNCRRQDFKLGKLSDQRVVRLEAVPGWSWNGLDERWKRQIDGYAGWLEANGAQPRSNAVGVEGRLAAWATRCRNLHEKGQLSADRVDELASMPGWTWEGKHETFWRESVTFLTDWAVRNDRLPKPKSHDVDEQRAWRCVSAQRASYKGGKLSPERIAVIEAIPGWTWRGRS